MNTLHLPQGPIQYLQQGSGRPIVFVHGLIADHQIWQPLLPALGPGWRCILPTWPLGAHRLAMKPGADLSVPGMAQLIADFIEVLDLRDVVLVGNDTGGALTQIVCARFPERIGAMVLTTCDAYDVFPPWMFGFLKWWGHVPGLAWACMQVLRHVPLLRGLPMAFGDLTDRGLSREMVESWIRPVCEDGGVRRDLRGFLRSLTSRYTQAAGQALRSFDKPVLLLWSTRCHHFPKRLAERLQRELPDAKLHWIDSQGVFLSLDYPDQVAAHIRRFGAPVVQPLRQAV